MNLNTKLLSNELNNILQYWNQNLITENSIHPEIDIHDKVNLTADLGSMYLARVLYGLSVATKTLNKDTHKAFAEQTHHLLITNFKNPKGAYKWAINHQTQDIHDVDNNNLAQAFVLYGLAEYASINKHTALLDEINQHIEFILNTISDSTNGGFFDGFDAEWNPLKDQNKALGTHLHFLEAFEKCYLLKNDKKLKTHIELLINIIIDKFIDTETLHCWHRLSPDWKPLPNEIWAGHDVEVSWILCKAAKTIDNKVLMDKCNKLAIKMVDNTLNLAYDKVNGGMFNVLENGKPSESIKIWWPQAEMVIALLNCYEITGDEKYLVKANEFSTYISSNLISDKGEWFTELSIDNKPIETTPMVFFWKSLYHNVRYYAEVIERINNLNIDSLSFNGVSKKGAFS